MTVELGPRPPAGAALCSGVHRGGYFGRYLPGSNRSGYLIYIHQGTLFGVLFDPDRAEARGTPAPLLEDVAGDEPTAGGQLDVSGNGTLVYLSGKSPGQGQNRPVVWLDAAGKTQPLLATPGNYYTPRLSPDGKRLAFSAGTRDIQVYDLQRDTITRLTFKSRNDTYPVWTPDGRHIVFGVRSGFSLQWIRSDGAGESQRLWESKRELRPYSFSPDGMRLAFAEDSAETGFDIWTLPLDLSDPDRPKPGKPELFLRTPLVENEPAFSPDGRWIAYASWESGLPAVRVRPFPGPGGRWLISEGVHPIWSRNGRELFYETTSDNRIMVVTYSAKGDTFTAGKPRVWSDARILEPNNTYWNLDLGPDGKHFAVFPAPRAGEQKGSVHVTVLLNFIDELRRRAPVGK